jgi:hypothetical protein
MVAAPTRNVVRGDLNSSSAAIVGRRLCETRLAWETDPSMHDDERTTAFADVWCTISNVVFSRTLGRERVGRLDRRRPAWPRQRSSFGLVKELRGSQADRHGRGR